MMIQIDNETSFPKMQITAQPSQTKIAKIVCHYFTWVLLKGVSSYHSFPITTNGGKICLRNYGFRGKTSTELRNLSFKNTELRNRTQLRLQHMRKIAYGILNLMYVRIFAGYRSLMNSSLRQLLAETGSQCVLMSKIHHSISS